MRKTLAARLGSVALAIVAMLAAALLAMSPRPAVASSQNTIRVYPNFGGPGAQVTLTVVLAPGEASVYSMYYTTTKPDPACLNANARLLPVSGANNIRLNDGQNANAAYTFSWPSQLTPGRYFFCLRYESAIPQPTATARTTVASPTATTSHMPTATATATAQPVQHPFVAITLFPYVATRDIDATVQVDPGESLAMGGTTKVTISRWVTLGRTAPQHLWLMGIAQPENSADDLVEVPFTVTAPPNAAGVTKVQLSVPASFSGAASGASGQVILLAGGPGIIQRSDATPLLDSPAVTPTVEPTATAPVAAHTVTPKPPSGLWLIIGAIVAALMLASIGTAVILLQRRAAAAVNPASATSQPGQTPQWGAPAANTWDSPASGWNGPSATWESPGEQWNNPVGQWGSPERGPLANPQDTQATQWDAQADQWGNGGDWNTTRPRHPEWGE
ncbi:MAG TPA: hypothetical protein VF807_11100 [Ktedonobacterales bacterium]